MQDSRLPKKLLFGELKSGKWTRGVRRNASRTHLQHYWKGSTWIWITWKPWLKNETSGGASLWMVLLHLSQGGWENKRQLRKSRVNDNSTRSVPTNLVCPKCHRLFHARIGLFSHMHTHKPLYSFTVLMVIIILMDGQKKKKKSLS